LGNRRERSFKFEPKVLGYFYSILSSLLETMLPNSKLQYGLKSENSTLKLGVEPILSESGSELT
jgi:hypothetical protein